MNRDKYVFAQIAEFLDHNKFRRLVDKFADDSCVKHFTCWNQLLTLTFGQLNGRDSLCDLATVLEAHRSKHYRQRSAYEMLQILEVSLIDKTPLAELFGLENRIKPGNNGMPFLPELFD